MFPILLTATNPNSKPNTPRHHAYLPGLQEQHPHLRLDNQIPQLRDNQEIPICIAEGPVVHIRVDHVHVLRDALPEVRIPAAT